jgi:hypothetical protein
VLQLFDLARENASLKRELARIRQEAEVLRRLIAASAPTWANGSCCGRAALSTPGMRKEDEESPEDARPK